MPELAEKIESTCAAYLASFTTWPDSLLTAPDATTYRIFAGEAETEKTGQSIICYTSGDFTEYPSCSGNFWADVTIELKTPVSIDALGATDQLTDHQAAATILEPIIMAENFPSQLESNAANFTVFGLIDRQHIRERTAEYWLTGFKFKLYCCSSAISA